MSEVRIPVPGWLRSPAVLVPLGVALAAAVAVGILALVLVVVPTLRQVNRTLALVEQAMPILQEIGPEVDRIDRNVQQVSPDVAGLDEPISRMEENLGGLRAPIDRMATGLDEVGGSVGTLPELRRELARMHTTMRAIEADFDTAGSNIAAMLNRLDRLARDFERVVALLHKTAEHVESLDRKTGPSVND